MSSSPPLQTYREGQPRTLVEWTPGQVRSAIAIADGGSLRLASDLCDALLRDDRIAGVLGVRTHGLLRLPIRFEVDGDPDTTTPEEEALSADFWRAYPEPELAALTTWGRLLGVGVGEHQWEESPDGRVIPRLRVWHPRWLRFDWQAREWRLTVDDGSEITIQPGDGKWILYCPYGAERPWAHAPWVAVARAWILKVYAIQDFARHSEAHGGAVRVGTAPEGADATSKQQFESDIRTLMKDSAVLLPPGYDFKFVEATGQSWQQFPELIRLCNTAISIAISGQNLTSEVTGGSFAAASVHQTIASHLIESDEQTLSTTLHEQSLVWWAEFNFGSSDRAPWVRWDTTPPADRKAQADTLVAVGSAISQLSMAGVPLDVAELARRFDLPLVDDSSRLSSKSLSTPTQSKGWRKTVTLASGRPGPQSFADGQEYAAALAEQARDAAASVLANDVTTIRKLIDEASDLKSLRASLAAAYADMSPDALAEVTRRALLLAELAGRYALTEEVVDAQ